MIDEIEQSYVIAIQKAEASGDDGLAYELSRGLKEYQTYYKEENSNDTRQERLD